jgi:hypothetical protein
MFKGLIRAEAAIEFFGVADVFTGDARAGKPHVINRIVLL